MIRSFLVILFLAISTFAYGANFPGYDIEKGINLLSPSEQSRYREYLRKKFTPGESIPLSESQWIHEALIKAISIAEKDADWSESSKKPHPWPTGLFLLSYEYFTLGGDAYDNGKEKEAKELLKTGISLADKCIEHRGPFPLEPCRFAKASLTAKLASINGVLSSLSKAKFIKEVWTDGGNWKHDYHVSANASLRSAAHYALGLFNRLIPDMWIVEVLFGVRGNLNKSVDHHKKAVEIEPENPCYVFLYGVSLACRGNKNSKEDDRKLSLEMYDRASKMIPLEASQAICVKDPPRLKADPKLACGYTMAKQVDEEDAKKIEKK